MKILNLGSINIDHVYKVNQFNQPGETLQALSYKVYPGGKGFNQSIALAKSGVSVYHAGKIGEDGDWLIQHLQESGVDTSLIFQSSKPTGHAVIQVVPSAENSIIIYGGANSDIEKHTISKTMSFLSSGDYLLLQNEINSIDDVIKATINLGLTVIFNPAPMTKEVLSYPLEYVDWFILNLIEGREMVNQSDPHDILKSMVKQYPKAKTVLTLGKQGVLYGDCDQTLFVPAKKVRAVDTTAAGDTFIGFLFGAVIQGKDLKTALEWACCAAAICTTREGAGSIPDFEEVINFSADKY